MERLTRLEGTKGKSTWKVLLTDRTHRKARCLKGNRVCNMNELILLVVSILFVLCILLSFFKWLLED